MFRTATVCVIVVCSSGCGIAGPSCIRQQKRGPVTTVAGEVAPNQIASHLLPYAIEGSQNDVHVSWTGSALPEPPQLTVYATRADCAGFAPPPASNTGACAILGRAGWIDGHIARTLVITHGRGNPETLGSPPEYRVWLVADPDRTTRYTLEVTWFHGPDC